MEFPDQPISTEDACRTLLDRVDAGNTKQHCRLVQNFGTKGFDDRIFMSIKRLRVTQQET